MQIHMYTYVSLYFKCNVLRKASWGTFGMSRCVFQIFGETADTAEGAARGKCCPQHAKAAERRRAVLFTHVATDGTVRC